MAAVGVQLEGQDGIQGQIGTNLLPRPGLEHHQADPCNNAARAATDAARGAEEALDCHERGEPWRRRTGNENGLLLLELKDALDARRREREDKQA